MENTTENVDLFGYFVGQSTTFSIIGLVAVVAMWFIFAKANEESWKAIIPFYNTYILTKIATGNGWLFLLLFVPVVNLGFLVYLYYRLAKAFGRGIGFTVGLILVNIVFMLILAFDSSTYKGYDA